MKLILGSKASYFVDNLVLEGLALKYLEELDYNDSEVSLLVNDRGIVINGKSKNNLLETIKSLKVNFSEESGLEKSSVDEAQDQNSHLLVKELKSLVSKDVAVTEELNPASNRNS